jgi:hypothetical protein
MDTVSTGNPIFYTAEINNPQTKKPYLIKRSAFQGLWKEFGVQGSSAELGHECTLWNLAASVQMQRVV